MKKKLYINIFFILNSSLFLLLFYFCHIIFFIERIFKEKIKMIILFILFFSFIFFFFCHWYSIISLKSNWKDYYFQSYSFFFHWFIFIESFLWKEIKRFSSFFTLLSHKKFRKSFGIMYIWSKNLDRFITQDYCRNFVSSCFQQVTFKNESLSKSLSYVAIMNIVNDMNNTSFCVICRIKQDPHHYLVEERLSDH